MTDRITAALEAADKATPGQWIVGGMFTVRTEESSTDWICRTRDERHGHTGTEDNANATLIAAAPDMAAEIVKLRKWQSEALRWLQAVSEDAARYLEIYRNSEYRTMVPIIEKNIIDIDRLIAEAKEQGE